MDQAGSRCIQEPGIRSYGAENRIQPTDLGDYLAGDCSSAVGIRDYGSKYVKVGIHPLLNGLHRHVQVGYRVQLKPAGLNDGNHAAGCG
jgi:hypothetical protein